MAVGQDRSRARWQQGRMAEGLGRRAEGQEGRTTRGQEDSRARWQVNRMVNWQNAMTRINSRKNAMFSNTPFALHLRY